MKVMDGINKDINGKDNFQKWKAKLRWWLFGITTELCQVFSKPEDIMLSQRKHNSHCQTKIIDSAASSLTLPIFLSVLRYLRLNQQTLLSFSTDKT